MNSQAQPLRFVNISNPVRPGKEQRRLVRSHASREAYARIRQAAVANYLGLSDTTITTTASSTAHDHTTGKPAMPSPPTAESSTTDANRPSLALAAGRVDPFGAFAVPLGPMESFLLDHYIRVVIPTSTDLCKWFRGANSSLGTFYRHRMTVDWIPLALTDPGLLSGVLLAACRHLAVVEKQDTRKHVLNTMAIQYKLVSLQSLAATLAGDESAALGDSALAKVIALGTDEVCFFLIAVGNLEASKSHVLGAVKMADLRGGFENLGLNGLLAFLLRRLTSDKVVRGLVPSNNIQSYPHLISHLHPKTLYTNTTMAEPTPAIPRGSLILITGATGHVASELTRQFLERGYCVRGTVRDLAKASWLNRVFQPYVASGHFTLALVPDMTVPGAFSDAMKDVAAVAHVATIGLDPDPTKVIPPTVAAATSILRAAAAEPSVRRFVFTSSVVAAAMLAPGDATHVTKESWNEAVLDLAWATPPYGPDRAIPVYMASKVAAEREVWRFVSDERPPFVVNVVSPQVIWGERLNADCAAPSGAMLPDLYDGKPPATSFIPAVDVKDVGLLHVAAMLDGDTRSERIQAWGRYHTWNEVLDVLRKLYPRHKFIDDFTGLPDLSLTTDESKPLALMKKWGGEGEWRKFEDTVGDNLKNVKDE
ncbi:hypothetical protein S7711_10128 [Stachybotrys chartarum IBT 7711]|uniref:NAD-dependent epimerase/dehydratase domain-containing protein n=1 Tax=Stachybotrys chartarum (strain CBS 109288 / IBT 7711) TaxID=1280523 RepID=A0A084AF01_STACB|nr:hypothetical protein S7711_10128 [Stachybotrys chartarum IBT 7711]